MRLRKPTQRSERKQVAALKLQEGYSKALARCSNAQKAKQFHVLCEKGVQMDWETTLWALLEQEGERVATVDRALT